MINEKTLEVTEDEEYVLTPYGVLYLILNQYGFDTSKLTSTIGIHMLDDLIKGLMKIEYLPKMEFKSKCEYLEGTIDAIREDVNDLYDQ